jgi:mono/diheme cytochrome c family protein
MWRLAALLLLATPATPGARQGSDGFYWKNAPPAEGIPHQRRPRAGVPLVEEGALLYEKSCASCHGKGGRGDGRLAAHLQVPPRDFTLAVFKVRSTPSGSLPTDVDLFQTISRGMHGTDMAPWTRLTERQRWALVVYLKSLSPRFQGEDPEPAIEVPPPPGPRAALVKRGQILYGQLQCRNCHGPTGHADGPAVADYANEPGGVHIRDLARAFYLRGDTAKDIYLTLRTGLDGTPMGAFELDPAELWSLAFYVHDVLREPPRPDPGPRAEQRE